MRSLGKKLLEAAKESDSPLARMIVDGKYKPQKEALETRKSPRYSKTKKRNRKRNKGRFQKPISRSTQPEVVEVKPDQNP